jgi:hypothetical protein
VAVGLAGMEKLAFVFPLNSTAKDMKSLGCNLNSFVFDARSIVSDILSIIGKCDQNNFLYKLERLAQRFLHNSSQNKKLVSWAFLMVKEFGRS